MLSDVSALACRLELDWLAPLEDDPFEVVRGPRELSVSPSSK